MEEEKKESTQVTEIKGEALFSRKTWVVIITVIVLMGLAYVLASASYNDTKESIIGKWELSAVTQDGTTYQKQELVNHGVSIISYDFFVYDNQNAVIIDHVEKQYAMNWELRGWHTISIIYNSKEDGRLRYEDNKIYYDSPEITMVFEKAN